MASKNEYELAISIAAKIDKDLKKAVERAASQLEAVREATDDSAGAYSRLETELKAQQKLMKALKKEYAGVVLEQGESSKEAKDLRKQIDKLNGELHENKSRINDADAATERWNDTAEDASESSMAWDVALGTLAANGITALISKVGESISKVAGLAEETREFRQDMGTLETAFDKAGYSAETATGTWKNLYSIFGEDDRAVEAANNIARIAQNEKDLNDWVTITTGIWGTYQDALPVESLAEAAAETANVGKVSGSLADALNWSSEAAEMFSSYMSEDVTTAEDAFNAALAGCTTNAERQALVTDTLLSLYGDAAATYEDTASSIMAANAASADMALTQAEMGATMEPVMTAVDEGMVSLAQAALELMQNIDMEAVVEGVNEAFDSMAEVLPGLLDGAIDFAAEALPAIIEGAAWLLDNLPTLVSIGGTIAAILLAQKIATLGKAAADIAATAASKGMTIAQYAWNAAMSANPIGLIITAIGLLVTAFITLWNNCEGFRDFWIGLWEGIKSTVAAVGEWFFDTFIPWIDEVAQGIIGIFKAPINGVIMLINWFIRQINKISFDLPDWGILGDLAGEHIGFDIAEIALLANGGVVTAPTLSMIGEGDEPEAVIPLSKLSDLLSGNATSFGGSVSDGYITYSPVLNFYGSVDKEDVEDALDDDFERFREYMERYLRERCRLDF